MEYINEINITEAVIHILDAGSDEPLLNEYALELNDDTYMFLLKHIERCLKDEELKYAKFNENRGIVKEITREYFEGTINIIDASKELARQMFAQIKANANIPSCDLLVISIVTEYGPMLVILKMDYVKNFTHKVDFIENRIGINIIPQTAGLPNSSQRIHKGAFIKPVKEGADFDLMVIDKSAKSKKNDEYGSNYFINSYLGCSFLANERDMTKAFLNTAETFTRNHITDDASKAEEVRTAVKKALRTDEVINVEKISDELFNDDAAKKMQFKEFAAAQGIGEEVKVDKEWVEKKLKRVRLKIDSDIDLYIGEEAYHDKDRFEIVRNGDGSINIVLKHIKNYIEK